MGGTGICNDWSHVWRLALASDPANWIFQYTKFKGRANLTIFVGPQMSSTLRLTGNSGNHVRHTSVEWCNFDCLELRVILFVV